MELTFMGGRLDNKYKIIIMSKHIELAKKLKALADKGIGGEKVTAEKMLQALLKKHHISIEEIEGEAKKDFYFKLEKGEDQLWHQIIATVNREIKCYGEFPKKDINKYMLEGNYMITCTHSEYIEIEAKLNFYQRLYKQELDVFFSAFIDANNLYPSDSKTLTQDELTKEELAQIRKIHAMSRGITAGQFRKQIS